MYTIIYGNLGREKLNRNCNNIVLRSLFWDSVRYRTKNAQDTLNV